MVPVCTRESRQATHFYVGRQLLSCVLGVIDKITTEVLTSKQKRFPLVTFVDSPGLVDNISYPFDVEKSVVWLGKLADIVLVFFDGQGQAQGQKFLDTLGRQHWM